MKTAAIRHLAETQTPASLAAAEQALLHGRPPAIEVAGASAGEQLTHVLAAQFVLDYRQAHGVGVAAAVRAFSVRVRQSIS